jgi:PmbA protein
MDTVELAKELLRLMENAGVDEGEVYLTKVRGLEMSLRDQAVERLRNKDTAGFALRIVNDNRMSFVHSSDLRVSSLEQAVDKALELAKSAAPDESNRLAEASGEAPSVETFDDAAGDISYERKLGLLRDIETMCFAYDPLVSKLEALGYEDSLSETVIANTKGILRHDHSTHYAVEVSVVAERDGDVETGGEYAESRFFGDLAPPSQIAERACWKATSLLGGKPVNSQSVPVVFDRDTGYAFLRHIFAMIDGGNIADGLSILENRIGDTIASPLVSIIDDPIIRGGIGSRSFDGEGVPSTRTVVVDRGVLRSFLFDTKAAGKAGYQSTGNATRRGFRSLPSVGTSNFFIEAGGTSPEQLRASTEKGLWVMSLAGWWVNISPSTGDFSSGAKGMWIEEGEFARPVRNVTIASNILDMLAGVDAVADDLFFKHESVSPSFRIQEMTVGGV